MTMTAQFSISTAWPRANARSLCVYINADKTELMYFKHEAIFTQTGKFIKLDQFILFGSTIWSIDSNIKIPQARACNAIDRLLIIHISDLSNKIKQDFFQAVEILQDGHTIGTSIKCVE